MALGEGGGRLSLHNSHICLKINQFILFCQDVLCLTADGVRVLQVWMAQSAGIYLWGGGIPRPQY